MIIYSNTAAEFIHTVEINQITVEIEKAFTEVFGKRPNPAERTAWNNSMQFMERVIRNSKVADDCGIAIEYGIPSTSLRVDFIITGKDENQNDNFIIIELKQWEKIESTEKQFLVRTYTGGGVREVTHPSYQAWSYHQHLADMNEAVHSNDIAGHACAYLHNYRTSDPEPLYREQYQEVVSQAPLFFADDTAKLQQFVYKHVGKGKGMRLLYEIENGRIRPSKKLIDHVHSLLEGNSSFVLLEDQRIAYDTIMHLTNQTAKKRTIIVQGGPGTGKSVISMNALGGLLKMQQNVKFIAPNASFRSVMVDQLTSQVEKNKARVRGLFAGSGQFVDLAVNEFDTLIVDEAHRLKGKGAYQYRGENQVEDIVKASWNQVFFIDDFQRIRPDDIGTVDEIKRVAERFGSEVYELYLTAQFRCSGAEGYMNWLDHTLHIRETGNYNGWDQQSFEFEIMDSPHEVRNRIKQKVEEGYKARMLAGFAWNWTNEKEGNRNGEIEDVVIEEYDFRMPWNGRSISTLWAVHDSGLDQIGCVHTSQGLEFDYVGVIIGNDLRFDPDAMEYYADFNAYKDRTGKKGLKNDPVKLTQLVKNIYKVLLSRGMKGCYLFCRDKNLQNYLRERLHSIYREKEDYE